MAAPVVAGSAALLRQYFMDGFWPSGRRNPADALLPSAALLRATLIGGTVGLAGFEAGSGLPVDLPPSFRQGFGRLLLGEVEGRRLAVQSWCMQLAVGLPGKPRCCPARSVLLLPAPSRLATDNSVYLADAPRTTQLALIDRVPIEQSEAGGLQGLAGSS